MRSLYKIALKIWRDEAGVAMLEFSLIASLFIMLSFGTILWGIWLWERNALQHATMQAARCTILPPPPSSSSYTTKLCGSATTYGPMNLFATGGPMTQTSWTDNASATFTSVDPSNLNVYDCVTANYSFTLSTFFSKAIFAFTDSGLKPQICYTHP